MGVTRRVTVLTALAGCLGTASVPASRELALQVPAASGWTLVILGIAQDGGIPHLGCQESLCVDIRAGRRPAEKVASMGIVNPQHDLAYLFDATPDFRAQLETLTGGRPPDGVFLTHAHLGHYTGLMYLSTTRTRNCSRGRTSRARG